MSEFTFLKSEQVFGDNALEIFKKRNPRCAITDFSIALGGIVSSYHTNSDQSLSGRTGWWWIQDKKSAGIAYIIEYYGLESCEFVNNRMCGSRLALPFSSISSICSNRVRASDGIIEVEYGEYPGQAVSKNIQQQLENAYRRNALAKTGKEYTTDSRNNNEYGDGFLAKKHIEYEFQGKKYVRVQISGSFAVFDIQLSNREKYRVGDFVWIAVEPIKWLVDEKKNIAITEKIIFSGVQFNKDCNYQGNFNQTDIKKFIDNYFSKEIISRQIKMSNQEGMVNNKKKILMYSHSKR